MRNSCAYTLVIRNATHSKGRCPMNIEAEIARFHAEWDIDFGRKQIHRKPGSIWKSLVELIFPPKYPVIALYRFAKAQEATEAGIVYPEIIDRDRLPQIGAIPMRFVLNAPWEIPQGDLQTLYLGPLTQGNDILVPVFPQKGFFTTIWEILKVFAVLGSAIAFILYVIGAIGPLR